MAVTSDSRNAKFSMYEANFEPKMQTGHTLDTYLPVSVGSIQADFTEYVKKAINCDGTFDKIINNLNTLSNVLPNGIKLDVSSPQVQTNIRATLGKLVDEFSKLDLKDLASMYSSTNDFSGYSGLHFDSVQIYFSVRFIIIDGKLIALFSASYKDGFVSICDILKMSFTYNP